MSRRLSGFVWRCMALGAGFISVSACGGHHLEQYDFRDKTIALEYLEPPSPELRHGWLDLDEMDGSALKTAVRVGAGVAKEIEARRASSRLDSAVSRVDIANRLAERTLERASRYLGTRPSTDPNTADYVLEIRMESFGIDARSSRATYLFTKAEAVLIDRGTGREIWNEEVTGRDRLTPYAIGTGAIPSAIITAGTLHTVSVSDFVEALEQLTTYTSNLITDELRGALRDVRDK